MKTVALGEVADIERRGVDPSSLPPDTPYLGLEHIERGGRIIGHDTVAGAEVASAKFNFTVDHVLFGKLRPYLAKVSRPSFAGVCSTDILPIRPGHQLDRDYLAHYLGQPAMIDFASSRATGANLPRLSPAVLLKFPIPLPPLKEQRRIAAILDHSDALRANRRRILAHLERLTEAVFHDMFGAERASTRLGDLAEWKSGGTPSRANQALFDGAIPWFQSGELGAESIHDAAEHVSEAAISQSAAKLVPAGAILIGMYDTAALKSSIAAVQASCNQAVAFASINQRVATTQFVYWAVQVAKPRVLALRRGIRQKNLNLSLIRDIEIPAPPLEQQLRFAARTHEVGIQRAAVQRALAADDELFASLQSCAFKGEL